MSADRPVKVFKFKDVLFKISTCAPELLTSSIVYVAVPVHVASIEPSVPPKQDASEAVPAIEQGSIMEQSVVPVPPV